MAKMDYSKSERVKLKADFLRLILQSEINPARQSILIDFVENYVRLNSKEQQLFEETVQKENIQEVLDMITVYEERGIEKGIQQGAIQNAKQNVLEVLNLRFSSVPYLVKEKIEYCDDLNTLKKLLRQAALINSIDQLKF